MTAERKMVRKGARKDAVLTGRGMGEIYANGAFRAWEEVLLPYCIRTGNRTKWMGLVWEISGFSES